MPTTPTAETFTDPHGRVWVHVPDAPPAPRAAPPTRAQAPRAPADTSTSAPRPATPPAVGLEELQLGLGLLLRQLLGPVAQPHMPHSPAPPATPPSDDRLRIPPLGPPPHLRRAEGPPAPAEPTASHAPAVAPQTADVEPLRAAIEQLTLANQATQTMLNTLIQAQRATQELVASLVTTAVQRDQDARRHHELLASLVTAATQREQDARRHHELLASLVTAAVQREQDARDIGEKLAEMSETIAAQETHQTKVQREHYELLRRHSDRGQDGIQKQLDALHGDLRSLRDDPPPDKPRPAAPRPRALPASNHRADDPHGDLPPANLSLG